MPTINVCWRSLPRRCAQVLFIAKDSDLTVADWFAEVQAILDAQNCPVVQILDDDKGVHLIAAVNLIIAERQPSVQALKVAQVLRGACALQPLGSGAARCVARARAVPGREPCLRHQF